MKRFKNWKSELKKRGAMALTAFMLCGSAGTAFAQSTDITIHDGESGDIVTEGQPTPGNVKTVTGYQTDLAVGYAANITWGDMLFVYDRGTYDPSNGNLIGSFQDDSENPRLDIEINGDRLQAGFWYGFNGTNNAVKVENLSTENVKLTATPEVTSANKGEVKFSLYTENSDDMWSGLTDVYSGVNHDVYSGDSDGGKWGQGTTDGAISRTFAARTFNDDGSENATDSDVIYLNITGTPSSTFRDYTGYTNEGNKGEDLGTITLNFTMENDNELTEINGDAVSST